MTAALLYLPSRDVQNEVVNFVLRDTQLQRVTSTNFPTPLHVQIRRAVLMIFFSLIEEWEGPDAKVEVTAEDGADADDSAAEKRSPRDLPDSSGDSGQDESEDDYVEDDEVGRRVVKVGCPSSNGLIS